MSRISKDLAHQIAFKLTVGGRQEVDRLHKEYQEIATQAYESQTPEMIREAFKKHPQFFYTATEIRITGRGFNNEYIRTTRNIIPNSNSGRYSNYEPTVKTSETLTAAKRKYEKAEAAHKKLLQETEVAIINLRTYKNIGENIPAAKKYLPPPMSNALVVNVDNLVKKLAEQPEPKEGVEVEED